MAKPRISDKSILQIKNLCNKGYKSVDIAKEIGISKSTVDRYKSMFFKNAVTSLMLEENINLQKEKKPVFKIGDKVIVTKITRLGGEGKCNNKNRKILKKGEVVFHDSCKFILAFKNYKECFKYADVLVGDITAKKVSI